jgi:hypothetical protein
VVSVVVPLMLAVLPCARGRGFVSRSRLRMTLHGLLFNATPTNISPPSNGPAVIPTYVELCVFDTRH